MPDVKLFGDPLVEREDKSKKSGGYIYLLFQPPNLFKWGFATDVDQRMRQYKTHNGNIELLAKRKGDKALEKRIHEELNEYRRGGHEFFKLTPKCFKDLKVQKWIKRFGFDPEIVAEAVKQGTFNMLK